MRLVTASAIRTASRHSSCRAAVSPLRLDLHHAHSVLDPVLAPAQSLLEILSLLTQGDPEIE